MFGPADVFPYAEGRSYTPPDAPQSRLAALHAHLGIRRAVVVQANCHGADHAALLDALAAAKPLSRRGAAGGGCDPSVGTRCTTPACAGPASTSCPIWAARRTRPSSTMWSA